MGPLTTNLELVVLVNIGGGTKVRQLGGTNALPDCPALALQCLQIHIRQRDVKNRI